MPAPDRKGRATRTPEYIHPPLSVVIRLQPKGGLSACIRFDQKSGTKNPDLLSQIRILVVEVTGFEPATFWSRNPNMRSAMLFHVRCCYKKEPLSLDMIGQGQKHSVAIPLQQIADTDQRQCKT